MATLEKNLPERIGTRELRISLKADTKFENIVRYLEKTLTIPEIPGINGCDPCLSGLDRLVLEDSVINQLRDIPFRR
ncbi:MAG: hypothetical protein AB8G16_17020 [Gammaproteobacteria bacterium]